MKRGTPACAKALIVALVMMLVMSLGSACMASKETRDDAKELRHRLGTPSWASAVDVGTGLDGRLEDHVQVTVTLTSKATAADVAAFVEALPDQADKVGLDLPGLTFVSSARARLEVTWGDDVVADDVTRGVTEWLGIADALGGSVAATAGTDGGASYVVTLGDGPSSAVRDAFDSVATLTQPDTAWDVTATAGALALDLSSSTPPTAEQLGTWDAMLGALDALPRDLPASTLSLHFLDRVVAGIDLQVPDGATEESFTIAAYGDRLWPVIRPQLRAMSGLPTAWTYTASWHPVSADYDDNFFLALLSDQEPTDNGDETTRWSQAAEDYVAGL